MSLPQPSHKRPRPRLLSFFTRNRIKSSVCRKSTAAPAPSQNMCMFVMVLPDSRFHPPPPWRVHCRRSHRYSTHPQAIRSPSRIARSNSHKQKHLESPTALSVWHRKTKCLALVSRKIMRLQPIGRRPRSPPPTPTLNTISTGTPRARLFSGTSAGELDPVQEHQLGDRQRRELVKPVLVHVPERIHVMLPHEHQVHPPPWRAEHL